MTRHGPAHGWYRRQSNLVLSSGACAASLESFKERYAAYSYQPGDVSKFSFFLHVPRHDWGACACLCSSRDDTSCVAGPPAGPCSPAFCEWHFAHRCGKPKLRRDGNEPAGHPNDLRVFPTAAAPGALILTTDFASPSCIQAPSATWSQATTTLAPLMQCRRAPPSSRRSGVRSTGSSPRTRWQTRSVRPGALSWLVRLEAGRPVFPSPMQVAARRTTAGWDKQAKGRQTDLESRGRPFQQIDNIYPWSVLVPSMRDVRAPQLPSHLPSSNSPSDAWMRKARHSSSDHFGGRPLPLRGLDSRAGCTLLCICIFQALMRTMYIRRRLPGGKATTRRSRTCGSRAGTG